MGPRDGEADCKELRDFPIPGGSNRWIMGDLIDRTHKGLISKVMHEEKVFDAWFHGRTVVLDDGMYIK